MSHISLELELLYVYNDSNNKALVFRVCIIPDCITVNN